MLENKNTDPKSEDNEKESLSNNTTSKPTVDNTNTSQEDNQEVNESPKEEVKTAEKKEEKEVVDYIKLSLEDLVSSLKAVLASNEVQHIKSEVEAIKSAFNKKFGALLSEKKKAFLLCEKLFNFSLSDARTRKNFFNRRGEFRGLFSFVLEVRLQVHEVGQQALLRFFKSCGFHCILGIGGNPLKGFAVSD